MALNAEEEAELKALLAEAGITEDAVLEEIQPKQAYGLLDEVDEPAPRSGPVRTRFDQFMQGSTANFADEAYDPIGAAVAVLASDPVGFMKGEVNDPALAEEILNLRDTTQDRLARQREKRPGIALAYNLGGAIAGGATAAGALKSVGAKIAPAVTNAIGNFAKAHPYITSAGLGAGGSGLYAAGEATGGIKDRLDAATLPAVAGMVIGPIGTKLARGVGRTVADFADSPVRGQLSGVPQSAIPAGAAPSAAVAGILDDPAEQAVMTAPVSAGAGLLDEPMEISDVTRIYGDQVGKFADGKQGVIPMTKAQREQNVGLQLAENLARERGNPVVNNAYYQQQLEALKPFQSVLGTEQPINKLDLDTRMIDETSRLVGQIRGAYDDAGRVVSEAYQTAEGKTAYLPVDKIDDLKLALDGVYKSKVSEYQTGKFKTYEDTVAELELIKNKIKEGGLNEVTIKDLENWKKLSLNAINPEGSSISTPSAYGVIEEANAAYERFMDDLLDNSMLNGDDTAIEAFRTARKLASERFQFRDASPVLKRIIENRSIDNNEAANLLFGAGKFTGKDTGEAIEKAIEFSGPRSPELIDAARKGVLAKILGASVSDTKNPVNTEMQQLAYGHMKTTLNNLMTKQRGTFDALFDETERAYFKQMSKDLDFITSWQKGSVNNSGTGSRIADMTLAMGRLVNNPVFKMVPGVNAAAATVEKPFIMSAESIITGQVEKSAQEVFAGMTDVVKQYRGAPTFYGGYIGGIYGPESAGRAWDSVMGTQQNEQQSEEAQ